MEQGVIYNVTTAVMPQIEQQWLQWMKDVHMPEVLATGCFEKHQLVKLLHQEADHATYAVQYYAASKAAYNRYENLYADSLRKAVRDKWGENALSFATLMAIID